jgi:hypothetical protein
MGQRASAGPASREVVGPLSLSLPIDRDRPHGMPIYPSQASFQDSRVSRFGDPARQKRALAELMA